MADLMGPGTATGLATYDPNLGTEKGQALNNVSTPASDYTKAIWDNITNYTGYNSLISKISSNVTSGEGALKVNNTVFGLNGPTFNRQYSEVNTTSQATNLLKNTLTNTATSLLGKADSLKSPLSMIQTRVDANQYLNKPNVTINLSSEGIIKPGTINLNKYTPPANIVKKSWDDIGKMIDEKIKDTFLTQLFGLKGTDIMCSGICILMALLPCKTANEIIDAIQTIKDYQTMIKSSVSMVNSFSDAASSNVNQAFGSYGPVAGLLNVSQFKDTMSTAIQGLKSNDGSKADKAFALVNATIKEASLIVKTLNLLISLIRIAKIDFKKLLAWMEGGLYDLLNNVLFALQAMAVKMADSILNKLIAPVEKLLKGLVPDKCGTLAKIFFAKIMAIIYNFKNKLLNFIADLFSFLKISHTKFELFGKDAPWMLQLSAFLKLFQLLLDNFLDIAIGCGIKKRDCNDNSATLYTPSMANPSLDTNFNDFIPNTPIGAIVDKLTEIKPIAQLPVMTNLDDIANKLQDRIKIIVPDATISIGPNQETIKKLENMPNQIKDILNNSSLGPGVTIYQDPFSSNAVLVYENPALCGA